MATPTPLVLTPAERILITTLRDMPESPLRDRVLALLDELLAFARNPRCPEFQPDGVPCEEPGADCDQCREVTERLEAVGRRIPAPRVL